jgi:hypothetical protein
MFSNEYSCPSQEQPQSEHPPHKQGLDVSNSCVLTINVVITLVIIHHVNLATQLAKNWFHFSH